MKRLTDIDAYKALLILLVVLGHVLQVRGADFEHNLLIKFIYSHHMAAFFFLSGYVTFRESWSLSKLLKRIGYLLIPFFGWRLMAWGILDRDNLFASLWGLLQAPDTGLWFLYVLALCHLLTVLGVLLAKKNLPVILSGACFAVLLTVIELKSGYRHFGFDFVAWYYWFYLLGMALRKYGSPWWDQLAASSAAKYVVLICGLCWLILLPPWQKNTDIVIPWFGTLPGVLAFGYRFMVILLAVTTESLLFKRVASLPKPIALLGQNTLGIYVTHGLILALLTPLLLHLPDLVAIPALLVAVLSLSPLSIFLIRKIPVMGRWLVG